MKDVISLGFLLLVISLCACDKKKAGPIQRSESEQTFRTSVVRLDEHCTQGINYRDFSSQLAEVKAAYRLWGLSAVGDEQGRHSSYNAALQKWSDAEEIWAVKIRRSGSRIYRFEEKAVDQVMVVLGRAKLHRSDPTPEDLRAGGNPPNNDDISLDKVVDALLREASGDLDFALKFVDVGTTVKEIERAESTAR